MCLAVKQKKKGNNMGRMKQETAIGKISEPLE